MTTRLYESNSKYAMNLAHLVSQAPALASSAKTLAKATAHPEVVAGLEGFDNHLAYRTFLVGHNIGATDFVLWAALKGEHPLIGLPDLTPLQPTSRRLAFPRVDSTLIYRDYLPTSIPSPPLKAFSMLLPNQNQKQDRPTRPPLPSPSDFKEQTRVRLSLDSPQSRVDTSTLCTQRRQS